MTHPLHTFRYCPRCGAPELQHPHDRALHCPQCELTYFHNVAAAVACIVLDDRNHILSVRRAREPAKGTLDLPGGFVDPHESAEAAARRELQEETGIVPQSLRYLFSLPNTYPYSGIDVFTADLFYLVRVPDFNGAHAAELVQPYRHERGKRRTQNRCHIVGNPAGSVPHVGGVQLRQVSAHRTEREAH